MQYRIWDDMSACTQQDVARMLAYVPAARRAYALRYRHLFGQWTCLKAWEMVFELTGIHRDWLTGTYGKPYMEGHAHFSVSHCRLGVAVAVDDYPVGIDMEAVRSVDESLIRRTMNQAEQDTILNAAQPMVAFTRLWTQKEAVVKCLGTGITDDLHTVLDTLKTQALSVETMEHIDKGYIVSICTHK